MLALSSAWLGLIVCGISLTMLAYRPAFNDVLIPAALYGAVLAIGCGGLVLMRKPQPADPASALAAQRTQARVGIALGMFAVLIVYALMAMAQRTTH